MLLGSSEGSTSHGGYYPYIHGCSYFVVDAQRMSPRPRSSTKVYYMRDLKIYLDYLESIENVNYSKEVLT